MLTLRARRERAQAHGFVEVLGEARGARDGHAVVCGGQGLRHHLGVFVSRDAAEVWAKNARCCPARHQVVRVRDVVVAPWSEAGQ